MYLSKSENIRYSTADCTENASPDHSLVPPCQAACPLHMDIRQYVDLVAQGRVMEALQVIRNGNPFPSVCAYICNHPCEQSCRRSQVDGSVAIRALKRFAVEFGGDRMIQAKTETTHLERIAVIGSGPAGMACAYYLRRMGYPVTIFEAHSEIGGMLRSGIPQYRLPKVVLDTEERRLTHLGVEFRTNTRIVSLRLLFNMGYKAIFVTIGAQQSRRLGVDGEDKPGMVDAITFLREVNIGLKPAIEDKVLVVGGGNVAVDAARTARRLGANEVNLVCLESRPEMPAWDADIRDAVDEGVTINCSWGVKAVLGNDSVSGLELKRCTSVFDSTGKFSPSYDEDINVIIQAGTVITAIGQVPQVPSDFRLRIGRGSTIQVDPVTLNTNQAGVFAGGDAVSGPATAVQALATGRLAASRIHDYLQHRYPHIDTTLDKSPIGDLLPKTIEAIRKINRSEPQLRSVDVRINEFQPVELVYNWESAIDEARRCLRCGAGAEILFHDKCAACLTCLRVCPYEVPQIDAGGSVQVSPDQCQACGLCVTQCPARALALRKPNDRRQVDKELYNAFKEAKENLFSKAFSSGEGKGSKVSLPLIIGFCCQYGLFGTGKLSGLWRAATEGVLIIPVLCVAKVEAYHTLKAFEMGAEGVFVAGCGEQCARENTAAWVTNQIEKSRCVLTGIGLEPERLQTYFPENQNTFSHSSSNTAHIKPAEWLDEFMDLVRRLYLNSMIRKEAEVDSR